MDTAEIISLIFKVILIPLAGILVRYFVTFLLAKRDEAKAMTDSETAKKYIDMLTDTVTRCVIATNQTYVNALKEQGRFDEAAQKVAFDKTLNAIVEILSEDAKTYLRSITGDLNTYLVELIEAEVSKNKK